MSVPYPYSSGDKMEERYKYEYTPYVGKELLDSYVLSRTSVMKSLRVDLAKTESADDAASVLQSLPNLRTDTKEGCFCSISFFADILQRLYDNRKEQNDVASIFAFIKKYEVFKRLYLNYDKSTLRKSCKNYRNMLVYILFANVLTAYILAEEEIGKRTIAFNALLKLNDTIASVLENLSTFEEIALARHAFRRELEIYIELYAGGVS